MKKSIFTALALFLLVVSSAAHSQDPGTIKEWEAFVAKFPLATNEFYKNKEGEEVNNTEWHHSVVNDVIFVSFLNQC